MRNGGRNVQSRGLADVGDFECLVVARLSASAQLSISHQTTCKLALPCPANLLQGSELARFLLHLALAIDRPANIRNI